MGGTLVSSNRSGVKDIPVYFPACAVTQNSEKFVSTTQILSSVYSTAGPNSDNYDKWNVRSRAQPHLSSQCTSHVADLSKH